MEFILFKNIKFKTKNYYKTNKFTREAYTLILRPVFEYIGIGNARLWLLTNESKMRIAYGFGPTPKEDYKITYDFLENDKDNFMINLLKNDPKKFDREYAKRVFKKTNRGYKEVKQEIMAKRLEGRLSSKDFINKRRNPLQWVYENFEPIQVVDNESYLKKLIEDEVIYGDTNEHGIYIRSRRERMWEAFKKNPQMKNQYKDFSRFFYNGVLPLYVKNKNKKILIGMLEFDDPKEIIKNPCLPISKSKLEWACNVVNNTITPISLTFFTDRANKDFSEYITESLKRVIDVKDYYTEGHSDRVKNYSLMIGKYFNFSDKRLFNLKLSSLLHDIGKLAIPKKILEKKTKLTKKEFDIVKFHPLNSKKILLAIKFMKHLIPSVVAHHERYDGKGYPYGLYGNQISLEARIIALADTFDAITSERPYKKKKSVKDALNEIQKCKRSQFDPKVVDAFLKIINK